MQQHAHAQAKRMLPNAAALAALTIDDFLDTSLRLSDVLAAESKCLAEMKLNEIAKFQEEKVKLTRTLELCQQRIANDPTFIQRLDAKKRSELIAISDDLTVSLEENFRRASVARAVNERVMQAIRDVIGEKHRPGTYGKQGRLNQAADLALSFNLNQKA